MSEKSWLEVSLIVDGEMAEAVAEVMARYVPGGVVVESTEIAPDPNGEGFPVGPLRVCGYLPVDANLEESRHHLEEALWYLGRIRPLPALHYQSVVETDWTEVWKKHYQPVPVGERLMVLPAWINASGSERIPIYIDPGMAFGTGTHPTTKLCLEMLESWILSKHSHDCSRVIDIGCGSGILSVAALKLGVESALAVDTDAQAIAVSQENAALNGVLDRLELGVGSVAEVRAGLFSMQQAPIIVVNILAPVIMRLLDQGLGKLVAPGGFMILSGILEEQSVKLQAALQEYDLRVQSHRQKGDWVALGVKNLSDF
jgi:ribosomal protein L11 methyltransferase